MSKKLKNIVVISGGSGGSELLAALRGYANITAILPATDDGGSGGWVREKFKMIAPGDFRRALVALSYSKNKKLKENFLHRYTEGEFKGQVVGNLALASFYEETGDFDKAIAAASKMLDVRDTILPATKELTTLCAELENGTIVRGETHIDIATEPRAPVKHIFVDPQATIHPKAKQAMAKADFVIISVGDIYTSILANFVVKGMPEALQKTKAKVIMFVNSVTKYGESDGFSSSDFVKTLERYAGVGTIDYALVTVKKNPAIVSAISSLLKSKSEFVTPDIKNFPKHITPIPADWYPKTGLKTDPVKVRAILKKLGVIK